MKDFKLHKGYEWKTKEESMELKCTSMENIVAMLESKDLRYEGKLYNINLKHKYYLLELQKTAFEEILLDPSMFEEQCEDEWRICAVHPTLNILIVKRQRDNEGDNNNDEEEEVLRVKNYFFSKGVIANLVLAFKMGIFYFPPKLYQKTGATIQKICAAKKLKIQKQSLSQNDNENGVLICENEFGDAIELAEINENTSMDVFKKRFIEIQQSGGKGGSQVMKLRYLEDNVMNIDEELFKSLFRFIEYSELTIDYGCLLGKGSFADVYGGYYIGKQIAVKRIRDSFVKQHPQLLYKELLYLSLFADLNQSVVVKYYGFSRIPATKEIILISEMGISTLREYYKGMKNTTLEEKQKLALQVIQSIQWLHSNGLAHRDIKPDNIIVVKKGNKVQCKLGDFGTILLTSKESEGLRSTERTGTLCYGAPELFEKRIISKMKFAANNEILKSDIYSIGYVLYELYYGVEQPLVTESESVLIECYLKLTPQQEDLSDLLIPFMIPDECEWKDIILQCWQLNPTLRPTALQLEDMIKTSSKRVQNATHIVRNRFDNAMSSSLLVFVDYSNIFYGLKPSSEEIEYVLNQVVRNRMLEKGFVVGSRTLLKVKNIWEIFGYVTIPMRENGDFYIFQLLFSKYNVI